MRRNYGNEFSWIDARLTLGATSFLATMKCSLVANSPTSVSPFPAREGVGAPTPRSYLHRGEATSLQTRPCQHVKCPGMALRCGPPHYQDRNACAAKRCGTSQSKANRRSDARLCPTPSASLGSWMSRPKRPPHRHTARFGHFPTCPNLARRRSDRPDMAPPIFAMHGLMPAMPGPTGLRHEWQSEALQGVGLAYTERQGQAALGKAPHALALWGDTQSAPQSSYAGAPIIPGLALTQGIARDCLCLCI